MKSTWDDALFPWMRSGKSEYMYHAKFKLTFDIHSIFATPPQYHPQFALHVIQNKGKRK